MGLLLLVATAPATAAQPDAGDSGPLTLERSVRIALEHNPELAMLSSRAAALEAVPPQAGSLPDPVLSLNMANVPVDTFELDQEPMTQLQLGVSQRIPFPGKRQLRRDAAESEHRASEAQLAERRDLLIASVRSAWWGLYVTDRSLEIVARNQDLMRGFIEIAQTKYSVGGGLQQDVLLAQLELSRLLDRESTLRGRRRSTQARLNELLDRKPDQPVLLERTAARAVLPDLPSEQELLLRAQESRQLLNVHREMLIAADTRVDLAARDRYPDFRIGASYGLRQGEDPLTGNDRSDFFSVLFSVDLPIYARSRQTRAIEQRVAEREARSFSLSATARGIESDIGQKMSNYERAREQVLLLDTAIIPQAEQTVASMLAAYRVNEVDFLNVVNGQLTLYNAEISYWTVLGEAKSTLAGLAAAVGQEALYE